VGIRGSEQGEELGGRSILITYRCWRYIENKVLQLQGTLPCGCYSSILHQFLLKDILLWFELFFMEVKFN
jgi:hypothetical protein